LVGFGVGAPGVYVGAGVGSLVGLGDGANVGIGVGLPFTYVGVFVGDLVGAVGSNVVGTKVGLFVGFLV
jgi:hypothetical protein